MGIIIYLLIGFVLAIAGLVFLALDVPFDGNEDATMIGLTIFLSMLVWPIGLLVLAMWAVGRALMWVLPK